MNVKLKDLVNHIDTPGSQLAVMVNMLQGGTTTKPGEDMELNMFGTLVALVYDLCKQRGQDMETIAPMLAHHSANLKAYAVSFEATLDAYCADDGGKQLVIPTAFFETLDNRLVYFNWLNRPDLGVEADWRPYDMKPEAGPAPEMPPVMSFTVAVVAMYLRTIGAAVHEKAGKAFCAGVLFKKGGTDENQSTLLP